jgi:hypothetical protein
VTEPTSHVEQEIQRRIQAQRVKVQAARERRASLAEARRYGIARRHAAKLARLAEQEQRAAEERSRDEPGLDEDDDQDDDQDDDGGDGGDGGDGPARKTSVVRHRS